MSTQQSRSYGADRPRHLESFTVEVLDDQGDWLFVTTSRGSGFGLPVAKLDRRPVVGGTYDLETVNLSTVTGIRDGGGWLYRLSDQDLAEQHRKMLEDFAAKDRERLAANRDEWARREAALPEWARARIARFRVAGGEEFELKGWGYELAVCELAVLYAAGDTASVNEYARKHGTSGNQHDCAEFLARHISEGRSDDAAERVPAALSPITGSADYS